MYPLISLSVKTHTKFKTEALNYFFQTCANNLYLLNIMPETIYLTEVTYLEKVRNFSYEKVFFGCC